MLHHTEAKSYDSSATAEITNEDAHEGLVTGNGHPVQSIPLRESSNMISPPAVQTAHIIQATSRLGTSSRKMWIVISTFLLAACMTGGVVIGWTQRVKDFQGTTPALPDNFTTHSVHSTWRTTMLRNVCWRTPRWTSQLILSALILEREAWYLTGMLVAIVRVMTMGSPITLSTRHCVHNLSTSSLISKHLQFCIPRSTAFMTCATETFCEEKVGTALVTPLLITTTQPPPNSAIMELHFTTMILAPKLRPFRPLSHY